MQTADQDTINNEGETIQQLREDCASRHNIGGLRCYKSWNVATENRNKRLEINERGGCASSSVTTLKPDLRPKLHLPRRPQREDSRSWASAGRETIGRRGAVHFPSAAVQYAA